MQISENFVKKLQKRGKFHYKTIKKNTNSIKKSWKRCTFHQRIMKICAFRQRLANKSECINGWWETRFSSNDREKNTFCQLLRTQLLKFCQILQKETCKFHQTFPPKKTAEFMKRLWKILCKHSFRLFYDFSSHLAGWIKGILQIIYKILVKHYNAYQTQNIFLVITVL